MSWKQLNIKKLLLTLMWIGIGTCMVFLMAAAVKRKDQKHCKGIAIDISGVNNNFFIDKNDVLKIIRRFSGAEEKGKAVSDFSLRKIEAELKKQVWIKNAELFFDNNEVLQVEIEEREPVARVFTEGGNSFYIDSSSTMLPLSDKFSARLPVFTGFTSEAKVLSRPDSALLKDIRTVSMLMMADSFLMAMIDQVDILPTREFEMIPKLGKQVIHFGDGSDAAAKFDKMKLFYKNVIMKAGWNKYSVLDLQFSNQVVAKLRGREDIAADSLRTIQLMQVIAANAAKAAADSVQSFLQDNDKNTADTSLIQQSLQRDEIAEPSISNTVEKPTPQERIEPAKPAVVVKPPVTVTQPVRKPISKPAVQEKPKAAKTLMPKPPAKPKQQKPAAKSNDY